MELVNSARADVITSIINKFNTVERQEVKNPSRDIFVLVDESHRSNYGLMATRMRSVFPNACYIGFTGHAADEKRKEHHGPVRQADSQVHHPGRRGGWRDCPLT